eukprot:898083-Alexandrium_andersonii.AAC.1
MSASNDVQGSTAAKKVSQASYSDIRLQTGPNIEQAESAVANPCKEEPVGGLVTNPGTVGGD